MYISIKLPNGHSINRDINKPEIIIGRSLQCDVPVPEEALSRQHAKISNLNDQLYITDLGSSNGVFIDGERIQPHVQVPFNTFLQLSLGPLECYISLNSSDTKAAFKIPALQKTDDEKRTKITDKPLSPSAKNSKLYRLRAAKKEKDQSINPKFLGLILILGIGVIGYYQLDDHKDAEVAKDIGSPKKTQKPTEESLHIKAAPDKFLSDGMYYEKLKLKSLETDRTIAKDLQLELPFEGVAFEDNEVIIFMEPKKLLEDPRFASIREINGAEDVLAIYQILKSNVLYEMQQGKYSQIHLLITDADSKVKKIYRFHPEKFGKDANQKVDLLNKTADAILKNEIEKYLEMISPAIPAKQVEISPAP
jgi:hypothetical protein